MCAQVIERWLRPELARGGVAVMVVLAGLGVGAVNEIAEFFASQLVDTNVGGYQNTGWDLVADLVGAVVAAVYWWRRATTVTSGGSTTASSPGSTPVIASR